MFSYDFFYEAPNLLPTSKSMFRARLPSRKTQLIFWKRRKPCHTNRFSTLYETRSWNATLPPLDAALTVRFAENATRHVWSAAPATQNEDGGHQSAAPATRNATHLLKTTQKYCPCHTNRFLTLYENTLECHKVPRLPRETRLRDIWNLQKWPLLQNSPEARP